MVLKPSRHCPFGCTLRLKEWWHYMMGRHRGLLMLDPGKAQSQGILTAWLNLGKVTEVVVRRALGADLTVPPFRPLPPALVGVLGTVKL